MKEVRNICKSCKLVIKNFPSFIFVKLFQIISNVIIALIPVYTIQEIINIYYDNTSINKMIILCICAFTICALLQIGNFIFDLLEQRIKRLFIAKESVVFFNKLKEIDYDFHESPEFLNEYTRALEESVEHIYTTCNGIFNVLKIVITSLGMFVVLAQMHYLIIIFALVLAFIYVILRFVMSKIQFIASTKQRPFRRITRYNERAFTLKESMAELKTSEIGLLLQENNSIAHDNIIKVFDKYILPKTILSFIGNILLTILYPGIICILAYMTIGELSNKNIAEFSSMTVAATTISTLITQLSVAFGQVQNSVVECSVPFDLLKMKGKIESIKGSFVNDFESLELKNVVFSYTGNKNELENISMKINKGNKIAIVGHNGAGKTTLVKLLLRLYDANSGEILINNNNYKTIDPSSLRKQVGAVFQNVEVYAVSIAENILLRTPKNEEDIKIINEALEFSGLFEFVSKLPNGINTIVTKEFSKDGVVFSGGQNQRLAIARGYAHKYNLFILDEPSSALDPIAEAKVYENMLRLGIDKTIIFISHRLTTTVNADYIYLFENGQIIEQGTHDTLMKLNAKYAMMFNSQSKKYLGGEYDEE